MWSKFAKGTAALCQKICKWYVVTSNQLNLIKTFIIVSKSASRSRDINNRQTKFPQNETFSEEMYLRSPSNVYYRDFYKRS